MSELSARFLEMVGTRSLTVGVVGMGYVGLPLALTFAESGFRVLGFDTDPVKVQRLNAADSYIQHIDAARVTRAVGNGKLAATSDFGRAAEADALLICVPTPLTRQREPDMRYVLETSQQLSKTLRRGQLVVLESTTYPGTTSELVLPILSQSGLCHDSDFFVAYSPEREDPGNPNFSTTQIPKVVGGISQLATELAGALYSAVVSSTVPVRSTQHAEAVKLTENIFRAVNIALVNELKMVYEKMGIDVWEVLEAASSKPFGFMRFDPGPGLGGHCIPIDPFYLTWKAREYGMSTRFVELAGEINLSMPGYVVERLQQALNVRGKPLLAARVLLLGVAYKRDIDDPRESPAYALMQLLTERGATVSYHDPHIRRMPRLRSFPRQPALDSVPLTASRLQEVDAVLVATNHSSVDYDYVLQHAELIVDTRGVYRQPDAKVVKA